ncbi:hypothetical protein AK812_SmicGene10211 [Symbiodinium microadriaticum]|uniref:Uncharacterized protein n=1 Tax=Symbiodinium microadriaticum TaxID=2951 RepID=A0A1Q9EGD0_SYMMI|nr:hypothetical protein AK812_SmicGene10211 [Symbiodinium microadriaticum]
MPCCGASPDKSALADYAKLLRNQGDEGSPDFTAAPLLFPMYTVPVEALLQMTENEPHEVLKAKGVVVKFNEGMGNAVFVSHQWVGDNHPDPEFKQLRVLQDALRHLLCEMQNVPLDLFTEILVPSSKRLRLKELRSAPLFIWFDYFSCPQLLGQGPAQGSDSDLSKAINSIPAYVAKCRFFFALCPVVPQVSLSSVFTPMTWAARGWCRVERVCRELSKDHTWVMIKSGREMELISSSIAFPGGSAGEGLFTVQEDRNKLAPVLEGVLMRKMMFLLRAQDLVAFRVLYNMQSVHLRGFPTATIVRDLVPGFDSDDPLQNSSPSQEVDRFLYQNGLPNIHAFDKAGWAPLHYAALGGNPDLIRALLEQRVDVNCWTTKLGSSALSAGWAFESVTLRVLHLNSRAQQIFLRLGFDIEDEPAPKPSMSPLSMIMGLQAGP